MGASGAAQSQVLGSMAHTMGAKVAATLHHRGEHEVGTIGDPNDPHVYVPRAGWSQSADHPLKPNNAQWNQQHFVASELKRLYGEAKRKEYLQRETNAQLQERSDIRNRMLDEKEAFAELVNADAQRHTFDEGRRKAEAKKGTGMMRSGLDDQRADLSRRAHEARVREAQEAAELKMRTCQQMCEEMAEANRKKSQLNIDCKADMRNTEAKRVQGRLDKKKDNEKADKEMREALMQDEYRAEVKAGGVVEKMRQMEMCSNVYDRTAGKANRDKESAELNRIDNDEKKHLMRTDAYYASREQARERQRQTMVVELDRQMAAVNQKANCERLAKQADREAVQAASKRSMDAELAKAMQKKAEEQKLQQELRIMMLEREEREKRSGEPSKPTTLSTMNMVMSKNGSAIHAMSAMTATMDAARYIDKPMGREGRHGEQRVVPLDAEPPTLRKLMKDKSSKKMDVPFGSVLGGVVGTLGGGGGGIQTALMATGGPFLPMSAGLAVQDSKLASHWHLGLEPEQQQAGRQEARRREVAKAARNHD